MRVLVTGADRPTGALLSRQLGARDFAIQPVGLAAEIGADLGAAEAYRGVDLRAPEAVAAVIDGIEAVVHAQPHDPPVYRTDAELLEATARGTYVLMQAAGRAGVGRFVLLSQVSLFDAYPGDHAVQAHWRPWPRPEAAALAPWTAELVCREMARAGGVEVLALRLGALDAPEGTSAATAVAAVAQALNGPGPRAGYRWEVSHVVSGGRFAAAR